MKKVGIIGAGSFGTALSLILSKKGHKVTLTGRNKELLEDIRTNNMNIKYLPGVFLDKNIEVEDSLEETLRYKDFVLFAVSSQSFRKVLEKSKDYLKGNEIVINVAKGLEVGSGKTLSQVAKEVIPSIRYVSLSGPSHAEEVARNQPTTITCASFFEEDAKKTQELFMTSRFRVYTNDDLLGIELGGALKNILALGAGISDGIGFGDNAKAALMTRGMSEITRLGIAMGADENTFFGLSGMGDLIVTCTSMHSRNRRCGMLIGEGVEPKEAIDRIGMVVEGVTTTKAAYMIAKELKVDMPITNMIEKILEEEIKPKEAVEILMNRSAKDEGIKAYLEI